MYNQKHYQQIASCLSLMDCIRQLFMLHLIVWEQITTLKKRFVE
nr:MAG TPA: hypothetical protein [Caudoviricetes sp.]